MMLRLQRLWVQITADRKRFGVLCGVVLVGLLLWSRLIVVSNLPRTAVAEDEAGGLVALNDAAGGPPQSTDARGVPPLNGWAGPSQQAAASMQLDARGDAAQEPAGADNPIASPIAVKLHCLPNHDPFQINSDLFPPQRNEDVGQDGAKSTANHADNPVEAEARRTQQLHTMVNQLTLEAVLKQDEPLVVINARTYRQGDLVPAPNDESIRFRLSEVKHRSVVLEHEGRVFELKMQSPAGFRAR